MNPTATTYVGADVAQDTIAFCGPTAATIKNDPAALRAYLGTLPRAAHLVCEATGRHHHALHQACAAVARPLTVLNPAHARAYARSLGKLEKTDALDAAILRRFGHERQPAATLPPSNAQQTLRDLLMVRTALVEDIAEHRRRDRLLVPAAQRQLAMIIRTLQTRQRALDQQLDAWLESAPAHCQDRVQTLCLVVGVGVLSALQLIAYLPELGSCNRGQIAKLAGLAPLPWDSGTGHGVRCIQQGRAPARRVLYQCAVRRTLERHPPSSLPTTPRPRPAGQTGLRRCRPQTPNLPQRPAAPDRRTWRLSGSTPTHSSAPPRRGGRELNLT